jgi:SAM-dependent methyltransferase
MSLRQADRQILLRRGDGSASPLPIHRWIADATIEEEMLLMRIIGPALDIGCGPGRHVAALARRGIPVLGLDVAPSAIVLAQRRGAAVLQRSVFERVPASGRWNSALLLDGNIGIGGDAVTLLRRVGKLLRRGGRVLVEVGGPGSPTRSVVARLEAGTTTSDWFPWMEVGTDGIARLGRAAGFTMIERDAIASRWFVTLQRV